jgi:hypothetical protein
MCHLLRVPSEVMMSLMSNALGTHEHVSEAEGHRVCGGSRALPHRKAGLDPLYMWQYRSPIGMIMGPQTCGDVRSFLRRRRVWSRETRGDSRALS